MQADYTCDPFIVHGGLVVHMLIFWNLKVLNIVEESRVNFKGGWVRAGGGGGPVVQFLDR